MELEAKVYEINKHEEQEQHYEAQLRQKESVLQALTRKLNEEQFNGDQRVREARASKD